MHATHHFLLNAVRDVHCIVTDKFILKLAGCRTLETLRNSNIGQPRPSDMQEQDEEHGKQPYPQAHKDGEEFSEDNNDWLLDVDLTFDCFMNI